MVPPLGNEFDVGPGTDRKVPEKMRRPSYSAVTSTLALIVALGGGAYAAAIADNSVGTRHLKDDAVTNAKVADGAVGTAELKKDAVVTSKIKANAVSGGKIKNGTIGQDDLGGSARKVFGWEELKTMPNVTLPVTGSDEAQVTCPAGKVAVGGGFWRSHTDIEIWWSKAINSQTWEVSAYNPTGSNDRQIVAHVVCVNG